MVAAHAMLMCRSCAERPRDLRFTNAKLCRLCRQEIARKNAAVCRRCGKIEKALDALDRLVAAPKPEGVRILGLTESEERLFDNANKSGISLALLIIRDALKHKRDSVKGWDR